MPKITVIIPVYNVEKYIDKCINSILNQTFDDFELVLVDDGSTDFSFSICKKYLKDNRVKLFHKSNGGLSSARNYGLKHAQGKYVCFIDSDDYIDQKFLERLYYLINKENCDIAQCRLSKVYNGIYNNAESECIVEEVIKGKEILKEYLKQNKYCNRIYHNVCNKLFKRSLFEEVAFTEGIFYEDLDIMYTLLGKTSQIVLTNEKLYYYNKNNVNSITKTIDYKHLKDSFDISIRIYNDLKEKDYIQSELDYFTINQLIINYELSFYGTKTHEIVELRKKIRKSIKIINKQNNIIDSIKIYIRLLFPKLHKYYRMFLVQKNG